MKLVYKKLKQGDIKVIVESNDDLWYLSQIISQGDIVFGRTQRKIKVHEDADPVKKNIFLKIEVEKIEFHPDLLRLSGKVLEGPEDVSKGVYHTFNVEIGSVLGINKNSWFTYHLKTLEDSLKQKSAGILICVFDREEALFAVTTPVGFKVLSELKGSVAKKDVDALVKGNFYQEIIKKLKDYDLRLKPVFIILASPAFWRDELFAQLKDEVIKKKIIQATCAGVGENAINEVLKRDEVKTALFNERSRQDLIFVDTLLSEISKQGLAAYGFDVVKTAIACSAVRILLISTDFIRELQEKNIFKELNDLMAIVDHSKGDVHIISSEYEAGRQLDGLGGIAVLLRFKFA